MLENRDLEARRARGAFFTPPAIADYLAGWAVRDDPGARVMDPTCGEAVFLLSAARRLRELGADTADIARQVYGVDLHEESVKASKRLLAEEGLDATLRVDDFFNVPAPDQLGCPLPLMDAVIGNPPFIRYQEHIGDTRTQSLKAALAQGVRLNGLASSWAALLVHACGFLKPEGRLAMVLPAELLTVHYAEPVRRWLRRRFASVHLVMFERLQFEDALEKVVLVVAQGTGGCDAFSLHYVTDADDLKRIHAFDNFSVTPSDEGKWTDLWLPMRQRQLFKRVQESHFTALSNYGVPELGTVTGANRFFVMTEATRQEYRLTEKQVARTSPPGSKHLQGLSFSLRQWESLKQAGERVWLLRPEATDASRGLRAYVRHGEDLGVHEAYKCRVRSTWWRPPMAEPPDLFFTYMSHRYPKLVANTARVTYLNSMHGVRLNSECPRPARSALPLLVLNSVTMLGAEIHGRSYGGGVLKMEPREAAKLPVPTFPSLEAAWGLLKKDRDRLDRQLRDGRWTNVVKHVDRVLLHETMGLSFEDVADVHAAARSLRERRIGPRLDVMGTCPPTQRSAEPILKP
jgi:adenine-specific DNA-methyltransferase